MDHKDILFLTIKIFVFTSMVKNITNLFVLLCMVLTLIGTADATEIVVNDDERIYPSWKF